MTLVSNRRYDTTTFGKWQVVHLDIEAKVANIAIADDVLTALHPPETEVSGSGDAPHTVKVIKTHHFHPNKTPLHVGVYLASGLRSQSATQ